MQWHKEAIQLIGKQQQQHKLYLYSNFRVANKLISSSWHYMKKKKHLHVKNLNAMALKNIELYDTPSDI